MNSTPYREPASAPTHRHKWVLRWVGPIGSWGPLWQCRVCDRVAPLWLQYVLDAFPPVAEG